MWTAALPFENADSVGSRGGAGRRGYPAELRLRVVDLLARGRKVADVARDLGISARRVQAELVLGQGIRVGHQAIERLMRLAAIRGLAGRPRYRQSAPHAAATDRIGRQLTRKQPDNCG